MDRQIFIKISGIAGVLFVLAAYYLLWSIPETDLHEVVVRTRASIAINLVGNLMIIYYLFKR